MLVYVLKEFPIKTSVNVSKYKQRVPYKNNSYC